MQKKMFEGENAISLLADSLHETFSNGSKIAFFKGRSFDRNPEKQKLLDALKGYNVRHHLGSSNPDLNAVEAAVGFLKEFSPDLILAVGGGSVMDLAKAGNIFLANPQAISNNAQFSSKGLYFVAIPTTAGSGTEVTPFSSLRNQNGLAKFSFVNEFLIPDLAVLWYPLTFTLPPYETAITGLDALTQAVETYWSKNATEPTKEVSLRSIRLIMGSLPTAFKEPRNDEARQNMLLAANLSGQAIAIARTTICHAVSYPLTSRFNIPHGHAVFLTLPSFLEFNASYLDQNGGERLYQTLNAETAEQAADNLRSLGRNLNIEHRLSKLGISERDIPLILDNGFRPDRAQNNPVTVTREDLNKVLIGIL